MHNSCTIAPAAIVTKQRNDKNLCYIHKGKGFQKHVADRPENIFCQNPLSLISWLDFFLPALLAISLRLSTVTFFSLTSKTYLFHPFTLLLITKYIISFISNFRSPLSVWELYWVLRSKPHLLILLTVYKPSFSKRFLPLFLSPVKICMLVP